MSPVRFKEVRLFLKPDFSLRRTFLNGTASAPLRGLIINRRVPLAAALSRQCFPSSPGFPRSLASEAPRQWHPRGASRVRASCRAGFTLLEVILALTIFFGALTALSQLAWNGSRAAVQARLKTQAIVRCEAKLAEVLAGVEPMQPKTSVSFPDNSQWTYSVNIAESQFPDLLQVHVSVAHTGNSRLASVEFSLWRWMRDPSLYLKAAELKKTETQKESQSQGAKQ